MKFIIRDDDISYFTSYKDLEKIYKNIWDKIPVSFAVTPFINNRFKKLVEEIIPGRKKTIKFIKKLNKNKKLKSKLDKEFPLEKNKELVDFLREKYKKGKIDIMLHGYNHNFCENGYEFESDKNLKEKTKKGKEYLEKKLNANINIFVPPNNSLSRKGSKAVIKNKLNILIAYGYYPWERPLRIDYFYNFLRIFKIFLKYKRQISYPYILKFKDHKEMACYSFNKNTDINYLKNGFEYVLQKNGNFCIATHHWELLQNKKMLFDFYEFIKYVKKHKNIKFIKASELFI